PLVIGLHHTHAGLVKITANRVLGIAFQHFDNFAFRATTTVEAHNLHGNTVTVEYFAHLPVGQVNIVSAVAQHKAETITVALHDAGHQVDFFQRCKLAATIAD